MSTKQTNGTTKRYTNDDVDAIKRFIDDVTSSRLTVLGASSFTVSSLGWMWYRVSEYGVFDFTLEMTGMDAWFLYGMLLSFVIFYLSVMSAADRVMLDE